MVGSKKLGRRVPLQAVLVKGHEAVGGAGLARISGHDELADLGGDEVEAPVSIGAVSHTAPEVLNGVDKETLDELGRQPPLLRLAPLAVDERQVDIVGCQCL